MSAPFVSTARAKQRNDASNQLQKLIPFFTKEQNVEHRRCMKIFSLSRVPHKYKALPIIPCAFAYTRQSSNLEALDSLIRVSFICVYI